VNKPKYYEIKYYEIGKTYRDEDGGVFECKGFEPCDNQILGGPFKAAFCSACPGSPVFKDMIYKPRCEYSNGHILYDLVDTPTKPTKHYVGNMTKKEVIEGAPVFSPVLSKQQRKNLYVRGYEFFKEDSNQITRIFNAVLEEVESYEEE
jgi:hypothetical protein